MSRESLPLDGTDLGLAWFAKAIVGATFLLVLIGGHTTTSGAGMAFPDWPLSHGSLNPVGWWDDVMQRLEHGHRYMAEAVGLMIGVLCGWVWGSKWSVPLALGGAGIIAFVSARLGLAKPLVVHAGLWSSVLIFSGVLLGGRGSERQRATRWLAYAAFLGVCIQAVLGGLRVINDPAGSAAGNATTATVFRVVHGCFAQIELCLLVALATLLSPAWTRLRATEERRGLQWLAWATGAAIFLQLLIGATMRHLGAGLAITTFPLVNGGWLPIAEDVFTQLNFAHTRIGAGLVAVLVVALFWKALAEAGRERHIIRPAVLLLTLLLAQIAMGAFVIWGARPPILTTLHVVNGAAVLATTLLLALRASRGERGGLPTEQLREVSA